jgi:hypothetical protein
MSGFINKCFGYIPEASESCKCDDLRMTVLVMNNHHVEQIRIEYMGTPQTVHPNGHARPSVDTPSESSSPTSAPVEQPPEVPHTQYAQDS